MVRKLLFIVISSLVLTSCLTVERKEYVFEIREDMSGTLTVRYINIMSVMDGNTDISEDDYKDLIRKFIEGQYLENEYKGAVVSGKRLFEENGVLCGEVKIEFVDLASVGLFRLSENCSFMMCIEPCLDKETYASSNGIHGGSVMPAVFWDPDYRILTLSTTVTTPDKTTKSLLPVHLAKQH